MYTERYPAVLIYVLSSRWNSKSDDSDDDHDRDRRAPSPRAVVRRDHPILRLPGAARRGAVVPHPLLPNYVFTVFFNARNLISFICTTITARESANGMDGTYVY